jgi:hypothetical protein
MQYSEFPRSRKEAAAAGLTKYFDGKPCKNGHVEPRYLSGNCARCTVDRAAAWNARNPGAANARLKRYYEANRERVRAAGLKSKRKAMGIPEPLRPKPENCECCGRKPVGVNQMHLDHCHATGRFRG